MKATEQLSAMEMMAVDPLARVVAPRFWGGVISMPLLAALFSTIGVFGAYIVGVQADRHRRRRLLGQHAGRRRFSLRHRERRHQELRLRRRGQPDRGVRGLRCEVRPPRAFPARPRAPSSKARSTILALDFVLTVFMFRGCRDMKSETAPRSTSGSAFSSPSASARSCFSRCKRRQSGLVRHDAGLPARGALRQHRRAQGPRTGQGGRRGRRPRRVGSGSTRKTYQAIVTMKIDQGYEFTADTIASILTSGLLGEVYIGLDAGGDTQDAGQRRQ